MGKESGTSFLAADALTNRFTFLVSPMLGLIVVLAFALTPIFFHLGTDFLSMDVQALCSQFDHWCSSHQVLAKAYKVSDTLCILVVD